MQVVADKRLSNFLIALGKTIKDSSKQIIEANSEVSEARLKENSIYATTTNQVTTPQIKKFDRRDRTHNSTNKNVDNLHTANKKLRNAKLQADKHHIPKGKIKEN